jgi:hypothetical protein
VVEHRLAKARVAGSSPVSRSSQLGSDLAQACITGLASCMTPEVVFPVQGAVPKW